MEEEQRRRYFIGVIAVLFDRFLRSGKMAGLFPFWRVYLPIRILACVLNGERQCCCAHELM